jgi:uncharacterized protein with HEPN domain
MPVRSVIPRLHDMLEAFERVRHVVGELSLDDFEAEWEKGWLVERGVEILSEASRHLPDDLKARHPVIPWRKVAGIGNIIRHAYQRIAPDILWKLAHDDLGPLEAVCREEWALAHAQDGD